MAYTPFHADWKDFPDTTTPITAAALEYMEAGIVAAAAATTPSVFNVKDYGATGNGSTDDKVAIQAAIDAVTNTIGSVGGAGGAVFFPPGNYRISGGLTSSTRNIGLYGLPAGLGTGKTLGLGSTNIIMDNSAFVGFTWGATLTPDQCPYMAHLNWVGSASALGGVHYLDANEFTIEHCSFADFPAGYGFHSEGTRGAGSSQYGELNSVRSIGCLTAVKLTNCNGIRFNGGSLQGALSDTTIVTNSRGIHVVGTGCDTTRVMGTFVGVFDYLIDIEGGANHVINSMRGELMKTIGVRINNSEGSQIIGGDFVNSDSLANTGTGISIGSGASFTNICPYPLFSTLATHITNSSATTMYQTRLLKGAGDPGGAITGNPGDFYLDSTSGVRLFLKKTGVGTNTGWGQVTVA